MSVVYVTEQGALVAVKAGRLIVRRGDAVLRELRVDEVQQLALLGSVALSARATRVLLENHIDTVYMTLGGRFLGRLSNGLSKNILLRRSQHQRLSDPVFALRLAKAVVRAKVANQRRLLQRAQRRQPSQELARALASIRAALERVELASDLDQLRGIEGQVAAEYFGVFGSLLKAPGITFTTRKRRPPPDPVNLLLSFGYTMIGNVMQGLCEQAGFDPYVGALHAVSYGRPSLSLDLIEELRPLIVDTTVLAVLNRREITPADFIDLEPGAEVEDAWPEAGEEDEGDSTSSRPERTLIFQRTGVLKWVTAMERRMTDSTYYPPRNAVLSYRQIMREQVYALARTIEGGDEYQGFVASA